jgi:hypothetical protein
VSRPAGGDDGAFFPGRPPCATWHPPPLPSSTRHCHLYLDQDGGVAAKVVLVWHVWSGSRSFATGAESLWGLALLRYGVPPAVMLLYRFVQDELQSAALLNAGTARCHIWSSIRQESISIIGQVTRVRKPCDSC